MLKKYIHNTYIKKLEGTEGKFKGKQTIISVPFDSELQLLFIYSARDGRLDCVRQLAATFHLPPESSFLSLSLSAAVLLK